MLDTFVEMFEMEIVEKTGTSYRRLIFMRLLPRAESATFARHIVRYVSFELTRVTR